MKTRRDFFRNVADGLHGAALASLLGQDLLGASYDLKPKPTHFAPKA